jgi:hypothetical protein
VADSTPFPGGRLREHKEMMIESRELIEVASFIARKRKVSSMEVFPADGIGFFSKYDRQIRPGRMGYNAQLVLWNVGN